MNTETGDVFRLASSAASTAASRAASAALASSPARVGGFRLGLRLGLGGLAAAPASRRPWRQPFPSRLRPSRALPAWRSPASCSPASDGSSRARARRSSAAPRPWQDWPPPPAAPWWRARPRPPSARPPPWPPPPSWSPRPLPRPWLRDRLQDLQVPRRARRRRNMLASVGAPRRIAGPRSLPACGSAAAWPVPAPGAPGSA